MAMRKHEIIVGNVGTVYDGDSAGQASKTYREYVQMSKDDCGRVAGESVTWTKDGDIYKEYVGSVGAEE
jgi:hypothetical protein